MRNGVDERLLQHLRQQQRSLELWSPGLGDGRAHQQQRVSTPPRRDPAPSPGRGATVTVAAYNSSDKDKRGADIVCDHVDDQDQVSAALTYVAGSSAFAGHVHLYPGDFQFTVNVDVPPGCSVSGDPAHSTYIECVDCDGFDVPLSTAFFRDLYIWNSNLATRTTRGIRGSDARSILFEFGHIIDCELYGFDRCIDIISGHWHIERNLLWGYDNDHHNGWGVYVESGVGRSLITDNSFTGGKGLYIDAIECRVVSNRFRHTDSELQPWGEFPFTISPYADATEMLLNQFTTESRIASTLDGSSSRFIANSGSVRLDVRGTNNRVSNNSAPTLTVYGAGTKINDNDGMTLTIDAAATNTKYWGNETFGSTVDAGTGSQTNLDGSANDWNF